jgi:hypothetical protein
VTNSVKKFPEDVKLAGWFHDRDGSECHAYRSASTLNGMLCEHRRTVHPVFKVDEPKPEGEEP